MAKPKLSDLEDLTGASIDAIEQLHEIDKDIQALKNNIDDAGPRVFSRTKENLKSLSKSRKDEGKAVGVVHKLLKINESRLRKNVWKMLSIFDLEGQLADYKAKGTMPVDGAPIVVVNRMRVLWEEDPQRFNAWQEKKLLKYSDDPKVRSNIRNIFRLTKSAMATKKMLEHTDFKTASARWQLQELTNILKPSVLRDELEEAKDVLMTHAFDAGEVEERHNRSLGNSFGVTTKEVSKMREEGFHSSKLAKHSQFKYKDSKGKELANRDGFLYHGTKAESLEIDKKGNLILRFSKAHSHGMARESYIDTYVSQGVPTKIAKQLAPDGGISFAEIPNVSSVYAEYQQGQGGKSIIFEVNKKQIGNHTWEFRPFAETVRLKSQQDDGDFIKIPKGSYTVFKESGKTESKPLAMTVESLGYKMTAERFKSFSPKDLIRAALMEEMEEVGTGEQIEGLDRKIVRLNKELKKGLGRAAAFNIKDELKIIEKERAHLAKWNGRLGKPASFVLSMRMRSGEISLPHVMKTMDPIYTRLQAIGRVKDSSTLSFPQGEVRLSPLKGYTMDLVRSMKKRIGPEAWPRIIEDMRKKIAKVATKHPVKVTMGGLFIHALSDVVMVESLRAADHVAEASLGKNNWQAEGSFIGNLKKSGHAFMMEGNRISVNILDELLKAGVDEDSDVQIPMATSMSANSMTPFSWKSTQNIGEYPKDDAEQVVVRRDVGLSMNTQDRELLARHTNKQRKAFAVAVKAAIGIEQDYTPTKAAFAINSINAIESATDDLRDVYKHITPDIKKAVEYALAEKHLKGGDAYSRAVRGGTSFGRLVGDAAKDQVTDPDSKLHVGLTAAAIATDDTLVRATKAVGRAMYAGALQAHKNIHKTLDMFFPTARMAMATKLAMDETTWLAIDYDRGIADYKEHLERIDKKQVQRGQAIRNLPERIAKKFFGQDPNLNLLKQAVDGILWLDRVKIGYFGALSDPETVTSVDMRHYAQIPWSETNLFEKTLEHYNSDKARNHRFKDLQLVQYMGRWIYTAGKLGERIFHHTPGRKGQRRIYVPFASESWFLNNAAVGDEIDMTLHSEDAGNWVEDNPGLVDIAGAIVFQLGSPENMAIANFRNIRRMGLSVTKNYGKIYEGQVAKLMDSMVPKIKAAKTEKEAFDTAFAHIVGAFGEGRMADDVVETVVKIARMTDADAAKMGKIVKVLDDIPTTRGHLPGKKGELGQPIKITRARRAEIAKEESKVEMRLTRNGLFDFYTSKEGLEFKNPATEAMRHNSWIGSYFFDESLPNNVAGLKIIGETNKMLDAATEMQKSWFRRHPKIRKMIDDLSFEEKKTVFYIFNNRLSKAEYIAAAAKNEVPWFTPAVEKVADTIHMEGKIDWWYRKEIVPQSQATVERRINNLVKSRGVSSKDKDFQRGEALKLHARVSQEIAEGKEVTVYLGTHPKHAQAMTQGASASERSGETVRFTLNKGEALSRAQQQLDLKRYTGGTTFFDQKVIKISPKRIELGYKGGTWHRHDDALTPAFRKKYLNTPKKRAMYTEFHETGHVFAKEGKLKIPPGTPYVEEEGFVNRFAVETMEGGPARIKQVRKELRELGWRREDVGVNDLPVGKENMNQMRINGKIVQATASHGVIETKMVIPKGMKPVDGTLMTYEMPTVNFDLQTKMKYKNATPQILEEPLTFGTGLKTDIEIKTELIKRPLSIDEQRYYPEMRNVMDAERLNQSKINHALDRKLDAEIDMDIIMKEVKSLRAKKGAATKKGNKAEAKRIGERIEKEVAKVSQRNRKVVKIKKELDELGGIQDDLSNQRLAVEADLPALITVGERVVITHPATGREILASKETKEELARLFADQPPFLRDGIMFDIASALDIAERKGWNVKTLIESILNKKAVNNYSHWAPGTVERADRLKTMGREMWLQSFNHVGDRQMGEILFDSLDRIANRAPSELKEHAYTRLLQGFDQEILNLENMPIERFVSQGHKNRAVAELKRARFKVGDAKTVEQQNVVLRAYGVGWRGVKEGWLYLTPRWFTVNFCDNFSKNCFEIPIDEYYMAEQGRWSHAVVGPPLDPMAQFTSVIPGGGPASGITIPDINLGRGGGLVGRKVTGLTDAPVPGLSHVASAGRDLGDHLQQKANARLYEWSYARGMRDKMEGATVMGTNVTPAIANSWDEASRLGAAQNVSRVQFTGTRMTTFIKDGELIIPFFGFTVTNAKYGVNLPFKHPKSAKVIAMFLESKDRWERDARNGFKLPGGARLGPIDAIAFTDVTNMMENTLPVPIPYFMSPTEKKVMEKNGGQLKAWGQFLSSGAGSFMKGVPPQIKMVNAFIEGKPFRIRPELPDLKVSKKASREWIRANDSTIGYAANVWTGMFTGLTARENWTVMQSMSASEAGTTINRYGVNRQYAAHSMKNHFLKNEGKAELAPLNPIEALDNATEYAQKNNIFRGLGFPAHWDRNDEQALLQGSYDRYMANPNLSEARTIYSSMTYLQDIAVSPEFRDPELKQWSDDVNKMKSKEEKLEKAFEDTARTREVKLASPNWFDEHFGPGSEAREWLKKVREKGALIWDRFQSEIEIGRPAGAAQSKLDSIFEPHEQTADEVAKTVNAQMNIDKGSEPDIPPESQDTSEGTIPIFGTDGMPKEMVSMIRDMNRTGASQGAKIADTRQLISERIFSNQPGFEHLYKFPYMKADVNFKGTGWEIVDPNAFRYLTEDRNAPHYNPALALKLADLNAKSESTMNRILSAWGNIKDIDDLKVFSTGEYKLGDFKDAPVYFKSLFSGGKNEFAITKGGIKRSALAWAFHEKARQRTLLGLEPFKERGSQALYEYVYNGTIPYYMHNAQRAKQESKRRESAAELMPLIRLMQSAANLNDPNRVNTLRSDAMISANTKEGKDGFPKDWKKKLHAAGYGKLFGNYALARRVDSVAPILDIVYEDDGRGGKTFLPNRANKMIQARRIPELQIAAAHDKNIAQFLRQYDIPIDGKSVRQEAALMLATSDELGGRPFDLDADIVNQYPSIYDRRILSVQERDDLSTKKAATAVFSGVDLLGKVTSVLDSLERPSDPPMSFSSSFKLKQASEDGSDSSVKSGRLPTEGKFDLPVTGVEVPFGDRLETSPQTRGTSLNASISALGMPDNDRDYLAAYNMMASDIAKRGDTEPRLLFNQPADARSIRSVGGFAEHIVSENFRANKQLDKERDAEAKLFSPNPLFQEEYKKAWDLNHERPDMFMTFIHFLPQLPILGAARAGARVMRTANRLGLIGTDELAVINNGLSQANFMGQGVAAATTVMNVASGMMGADSFAQGRAKLIKAAAENPDSLVGKAASAKLRGAGIAGTVGDVFSFGAGIAASEGETNLAGGLGAAGGALQGLSLIMMSTPTPLTIGLGIALTAFGAFSGIAGGKASNKAKREREERQQRIDLRNKEIAAQRAEQKAEFDRRNSVRGLANNQRLISNSLVDRRRGNQQQDPIKKLARFFRRPTFQSGTGLEQQAERQGQRQFRPRF